MGIVLEPFHLNQIKKEIDDELGEGEKEEEEENDIESKNGEQTDFKNDLKLKPVYNNEELLKMKKKEKAELKKRLSKLRQILI